jgi:competence ComEA-like helix-hairpin-helix protein
VLILAIVFAGCAASEVPTRAIDETRYEISADAVNINTASAAEIEGIPYVGPQLAAKIVEHRNLHGRFKKAEHLMLVDGISDKRFRQIRHLIRIE